MATTLAAPSKGAKSSLSPGQWAKTLLQTSDISLALGVLVMIAIMILPVPAWLLDLFLTLNLAVGAILLMASVLTPHGPRIFTFPSLLLLTTLFRLALDVSATRLILTKANAGQVIKSFGDFAAGGNVVVGLVIFLIITLVQMIVIAKGAERTAEVTARFVSDSIPGRQTSIDADVTAGRISPQRAMEARQELTLEVQFFGRMTGAMQFIKGDSVGSLVVSAINIVGGLIVGVAMRGMPLPDAVKTYTLLTVGSGLVSQIPALVGSIAGSILISRVSEERAKTGLGESAVGQILAMPMGLVLASVMLFLLGIVPGMPTVPFWILAGGIGAGGYALMKKGQAPGLPAARPDQAEDLVEDLPASGGQLRYRMDHPLGISVHPGLVPGPNDLAQLKREINGHIEQLQSILGIPYPACEVGVNEELPERHFAIMRSGTMMYYAEVWPGRLLALPPKTRDVPDRASFPVSDGGKIEFSWVDAAHPMANNRKLYRSYTAFQAIAGHLRRELRILAPQFMGVNETHRWLDAARNLYGKLVDTVAPQPNSILALSWILGYLVEERVPITDARTILQALAPKGTAQPSIEASLNEVRIALKEGSAQYYRNHLGITGCMGLAPRLLEFLKIDPVAMRVGPDELQAFVRAIDEGTRSTAQAGQIPMLVVPQSVRRRLWNILHSNLPFEVLVMGHEEIPTIAKIEKIRDIAAPAMQQISAAPR